MGESRIINYLQQGEKMENGESELGFKKKTESPPTQKMEIGTIKDSRNGVAKKANKGASAWTLRTTGSRNPGDERLKKRNYGGGAPQHSSGRTGKKDNVRSKSSSKVKHQKEKLRARKDQEKCSRSDKTETKRKCQRRN